MESPNTISNLSYISLDQIDYEKVNEFCRQGFEEDIDLDYKADFPNDLEKIMCAFANTQGGVILLGVEELDKTRKPICPPFGIEGDADSMRQRIQNIAFEAIYPPLEPEIKSCQVPESNRYILVIRITQSSLLHAVDHRSRIYIRLKDNNRGYTLASLNQLQWLWDKRSNSLSLRQRLIDASIEHASSSAIRFPEKVSQADWQNSTHLFLFSTPAYPNLPIVNEARKLLDIVNSMDQVVSNWNNVERKVPWQVGKFRTITNGVCLLDRGYKHAAQYLECGNHGQVFFDFLIPKSSVNSLQFPRSTTEECIESYVILSSIDIAFRFLGVYYARLFFKKPIMLNASLNNISGKLLHFDWNPSTNHLAEERLSLPTLDQSIELLKFEINSIDLSNNIDNLLLSVAKSLIWSFGLGWEEKSIAKWLSNFSRVDYSKI